MEEENLDKEVLWNLQMMSEIVRSNGQELIKYKHLIVDVLSKSLRMTCKQGRLLMTTENCPCHRSREAVNCDVDDDIDGNGQVLKGV